MAQSEHISSTGHMLSDAAYLDVHFESSKPEYLRLVEMAGFRPGWHVLDAGCGGGSFLPIIAGYVGSTGRLTAIDLAPENVALTRERLAQWNLSTPVQVDEGPILDLPYADDSFDAVWCANVAQYLTDDELERAISEMRRVTRSGGSVVLKDVEQGISLDQPAPAGIVDRYFDAAVRAGNVQAKGVRRTWNLQRFLERCGLEGVRQQTVLVERRAPLGKATETLLGQYFKVLAEHALPLDLPEEDHHFWSKQLDFESDEALINHPDFYHAISQVLALGRVPTKGS